jgi:cytosine/adenosine deaminase-related metal-dependent hydrolase
MHPPTQIFVETHRHTWQSSLRHLGANWSAAQYFQHNFFRFGVNFRPEDVYVANLIGRLAALDGGITTLLDWSHIMNSPAHADAAVAALADSGGRSAFAMGWPQAPNPAAWITRSTENLPNDIRRVRKTYLSGNDGLTTLAMAGRGPDFATIEQLARDLRIARELDIRTTIHIGFAVAGRAAPSIESAGADRACVTAREGGSGTLTHAAMSSAPSSTPQRRTEQGLRVRSNAFSCTARPSSNRENGALAKRTPGTCRRRLGPHYLNTELSITRQYSATAAGSSTENFIVARISPCSDEGTDTMPISM